ncbi:MAG: hypothetical protein F4180_08865 [Chloroflexi bacterium]|nr:hypothetical protein [Chloroflexota bacterium]
MSSARRFCSCSDVPSQLKDDSLGYTADLTVSVVDAQAVSETTASDLNESRGRGETRFCTCSEAPTRLSGRDFGQPAIENVSGEPKNASGEVDERPAVSKVVPKTLPLKPATDAKSAEAVAPELRSVSELFPGETAVDSVSTHGKGGSEVVLTSRRVLLRGAPEAKVLHASMPLSEIGSVTISRARPSKRSLAWGLIGIGAAIGMWQALDGVGNMRLIIGAVVVLMSGLLLADYFLRPPDLQLVFRSHSGAEMTIEFGQSHADEADRFAAQVLAKLENSHTYRAI